MALDTPTKRGAAIQTGQAPGVVLPVPDGTIDAQDRADLVGVVTPSSAVGTDTTPDAFAFAPAINLERSTLTTSGGAVISGIDTASNISVVGGEYSIDLGAWVSSPGTINNAQTVRVRGTSSSNYATQSSVTLTIGGVSAIFYLQTRSAATGGDEAPPSRKKKKAAPKPKRSTLSLDKDRNLTEEIRDLYRDLTQEPGTRERAQQIAARAQPASKAQAIEKIRSMTADDEIALRMMHKELMDAIEEQDESVIQEMLARLL
jgi:hypothetical protein